MDEGSLRELFSSCTLPCIYSRGTLQHSYVEGLLVMMMMMMVVVVDEQRSVSVEKWAAHVSKLHADSNFGFAQEYDVSDRTPELMVLTIAVLLQG